MAASARPLSETSAHELDLIAHSLRGLLAPGGDELRAVTGAIVHAILEGFHTRDLPMKTLSYRQAAAAVARAEALLDRPDALAELSASQRRRLRNDLGRLHDTLAALIGGLALKC